MYYADWIVMPWGPEWRVHKDGVCVELGYRDRNDHGRESAERRAEKMNNE